MTLFSVSGGEQAISVRFVPLLAWLFIGVAGYGMVEIVTLMATGQLAITAGSLLALLALLIFTLFVFHAGGQLVLVSFDRVADRIRVSSYGPAGRRREERPLSEMVGLDVRILRRAQHRLELRLRSGERLPLTRYYIVTFGTRGLQRLSSLLGLEPTIIEPVKR